MICPNELCNSINSTFTPDHYCAECGSATVEHRCPCGKDLCRHHHFCPKCGKPAPAIKGVTVSLPFAGTTSADMGKFDEGYSAGLRDGMRIFAPQCIDALRDAADTLAQVHDTHIYGDDDHHPDNDCSYCKQVEGWRKLVEHFAPKMWLRVVEPQAGVVKGGQ